MAELIWDTVQMVRDPDPAVEAAARARLDNLTKPRGSLGALEELAVRLAAATGAVRPQVLPATVVVAAADHGVAAEGVSAYPAAVTPQMVLNFVRGGAAINALAAAAGARVRVVDAGVAVDLDHPAVERLKVRRGTDNLAVGPAMSRREAEETVAAGIRVAAEEALRGTRCLALGEMGIANSTAAAAVGAALTGLSPWQLVGRGTGVDDAGLARKQAAVSRGLGVNRPDPADPLDVLRKVGGLEIAFLCGLTLGAAARRVPVLVDGFIATSAALLAVRLCPAARHYLVAAHRSAEGGHGALLQDLGLTPLLDLGLRLGEGSGAALALPLLAAACRMMSDMATFGEAGVSDPV